MSRSVNFYRLLAGVFIVSIIAVIALLAVPKNNSEQFYVVEEEGISLALYKDRPPGRYLIPGSELVAEYDANGIIVKWGEVELPGKLESRTIETLESENFIIF
jgi:hypothetical protein